MTGSEKTKESILRNTGQGTAQVTEEKYRLIIENMTDVIWQTSPDMIITYVTPSVNELLGYEPQELVGQHLTHALTPAAKELILYRSPKILRQLAKKKGKDREVFEVEQIRKDGTTVWTEVATALSLNSAGKFIGFQGVTRNISKRKEDEEVLRASEEKFSKAFMLNPDVTVISRLDDGVIVLVNEGFTKTLGYKTEEVIGKTAFELNMWDNPEERKLMVEELKSKGKVNNFETNARTKNGQIRYGLASASIVELNGIKHSILIVKDITDRKRTEDALRQSEEKFSKAFFLSPDAISITRISDGIIVSVNEGFKQYLGYFEDEIIGTNALDPRLWANLEDRDRFLKELKAERKVANFEARFRAKDGNIEYGLISSSIITLDGEEHSLNVVRNITERKLAEEALRVSERKYRLLFDVVPIGIVLVDTEGNIIEVNRSILETFGSPDAEATKSFNIFTSPLLVEAGISDLFKTCMMEDRQIGAELFYPSQSRQTMCLRIILAPKSNEQGCVEGCLAVMEDIMPRKMAEKELTVARDELEARVKERTNNLLNANKKLELEIAERERAEQELQQSHLKLELALTVASQLRIQEEAASAAKSEFLANMSHELRTPLTAVIGFCDLLGDPLFGKLNEKQWEYLTEISSAGRHLLILINDILDLAKVESGKMDIKMSPVDLRGLLGHCMIMIRETAMKRGLTVDLKVSEQLDGNIQADDVRLKQIVMNLLSNAAKFTPSGGTILLEAERQGEEILVSVSDTGVGLKPDDKERIFQPFEQLDSSFSRQEQGTGLGLGLVRRLVELHGGRVWAESEGEGRGSTFKFVFPFVQTQEDTDAQLGSDLGRFPPLTVPDVPGEEKNRPKVFVVEDNESNMKFITDLLEAGGYDALQAFSGEQAIKRAELEKPSLILMDISLPGMDGLTATKVLKSNPATAHIPIVALSAHAMKDDEAKAREADCDAYIFKPIDTKIFYSVLSQLIKPEDSGTVA